ncbi:MAG: hypothetical protein WCB18_00560 [Thermoplasmata archaeon]
MAGAPEPASAVRLSTRSWIVVVAAVAGLALAVYVPAAPWYSDTNDVQHWTLENVTVDLNSTTTFYPGDNYRYLCYVYPLTAPVWGALCTQSQQEAGGILQPYEDAQLPLPGHTPPMELRNMYSAVFVLSSICFSVGAFATAVLILSRRQRVDWRASMIAALAFLAAAALGLGIVVGVAIFQPAAVLHDFGYIGGSPGYWSTFWGSTTCSATACGAPAGAAASTVWGPAIGWYLEAAAGSIFLGVGLIVLRTAIHQRRDKVASRAAVAKP